MKSYIKAIIIFNKNGEKRVVPLEQGVNIITGESKTGKSALVRDKCIHVKKTMQRIQVKGNLDHKSRL